MAEKHTKHVYPTGKLTFVIRDEAPFVHMQEPVSHRTVSIELTPWQMELLALKFTHSIGVNRFHEDVSSVFLEPGFTDIPPQPAGIPTAALEGEAKSVIDLLRECLPIVNEYRAWKQADLSGLVDRIDAALAALAPQP